MNSFFRTLLGINKPPAPSLPPATPTGVSNPPHYNHHVHAHHLPLLAHEAPPRRETLIASTTRPRPAADEDTDEPSLLTTIAAMELADELIHDPGLGGGGYSSPEPADGVNDTPAFAGFGGGDSGGGGATTDYSSSSDSGSSSSSDYSSSSSDSSSSYNSGSSYDSGSSSDSGSSDSSSF